MCYCSDQPAGADGGSNAVTRAPYDSEMTDFNGQWTSRLAETEIPEKLDALVTKLADNFSELEGEDRERMERVDHVMRFASNELQVRDPLLISEIKIASITTALTQIDNAWTAWSNGHESHKTTNANKIETSLGNLLDAIGSIPVTRSENTPDEELSTLRRSFGQYKGQAERAVSEFEQQTASAASDYAEQAAAAKASNAELVSEVERLQTETARLKQIGLDQEEAQRNAFSDAQDERNAKFSEQTATATTSLTDRLTELGDTAKTTLDEKIGTAESALVQIEEQKTRIEELVGIAGEETLIGQFSKVATNASKAANAWTIASIVLASIAVAIGVWLVQGASAMGTDWDLFAGRAVLVAAVGSISAYAAREAAEHRHTHREAEHVAVQLAALKPFLRDLDSEEDRNEVFKETALKIFGACLLYTSPSPRDS